MIFVGLLSAQATVKMLGQSFQSKLEKQKAVFQQKNVIIHSANFPHCLLFRKLNFF